MTDAAFEGRAATAAPIGPNKQKDSGMTLLERYRQVRSFSEYLCEPLAIEDYVIQSMTDASPTRWHLAHTSWFFETFVLRRSLQGYQSIHERYKYLFNSYYNTVGFQWPRPKRGLLSRPTVQEVYAYRTHVDQHMFELLDRIDAESNGELSAEIELGLQHEQQHQELILTDIKHVFSLNPLVPAYRDAQWNAAQDSESSRWVDFDEGLYWIGHEAKGFAFDNETPRHRVFVEAFRIGSRPVTNAEYLEFINDGGYQRSEFWLSDAWMVVSAERWNAPGYWHRRNGDWQVFTLHGLEDLKPNEPVAHVSYYEADAYARWAGARLPTEAEWEIASRQVAESGNFVEGGHYHPIAGAGQDGELRQMLGDVWEWTSSPYTPYPGYQAPMGAFGEYNGKFMCDQLVLRGGSCVTSRTHIRNTYRNFFPASARWQFSGIRLATAG